MWLITRHSSSINDWKILNLLCHWHEAGRICSISLLIRKNTLFPVIGSSKYRKGRLAKVILHRLLHLQASHEVQVLFINWVTLIYWMSSSFKIILKTRTSYSTVVIFFLLLWIYIPVFFLSTQLVIRIFPLWMELSHQQKTFALGIIWSHLAMFAMRPKSNKE